MQGTYNLDAAMQGKSCKVHTSLLLCIAALLYCLRTRMEEEEDFTSSVNQLGCTDVPGLSITWSKTSVLSVYHV